ncbi:MAG: class I SAM-dependent DNA methyltransferase [Candidatus Oleimicrobiaceae bacterium]
MRTESSRLGAERRYLRLWDLKAHFYRLFRWAPPFAILARRERALLAKALAQLPVHHGRALDLATGTGNGLTLLAGRYSAYGLDRSRIMLRYARRRVPRVAMVCGEARRPPFRSGSFALVSCIGLAEYLPEMGELLQAIGSLLCPKGAAVVSVSPANALLVARRALGHRLYYHDPEAVRKWAAISGLTVERVIASCSQRLYVLRKAGGPR